MCGENLGKMDANRRLVNVSIHASASLGAVLSMHALVGVLEPEECGSRDDDDHLKASRDRESVHLPNHTHSTGGILGTKMAIGAGLLPTRTGRLLRPVIPFGNLNLDGA